MPEEASNTTAAAHQVELAIRRLDSLSTLPCVAAGFLSNLQQSAPLSSAIAEIIESAPALTTKILLLMYRQGISFADESFSVPRAVGKLTVQTVRDAFFSVKVLQAQDDDEKRVLLRRQLVRHGLAVACCAKDIAEIISPKFNPQLAYSAGLLHDIGKLALQEVMPKSFTRIVEEAKSQQAGVCAIEQKYLGADHTTLGKRLARKWHLPEQIILAIWLHHSDTDIISQEIGEARIAQIVRLADCVARQCNIGQSGGYDSPDSAEQIAVSLAISPEQLEQIRGGLAETVEQKSKVLGLDLPRPQSSYCEIVHTTAAKLAKEQSKLSLENCRLQAASGHFDFITEFLSSIDSAAEAVDIAENFAVCWQKFYQTGMVCLYLAPAGNRQGLEAVVVENLSQSKIVSLNVSAETPVIPEVLQNRFAILNAHDYLDWLFEQLDVEFDLNQTKLMPLLSGGKAIGAIVFELRYPTDAELFEEKFKAVSSMAGVILEMASAWDRQRYFAEQFARLVGSPKESEPERTVRQRSALSRSLNALAEMAAGAAHELNNPLSVISGRAQLLAEAETDAAKKRMLKQIQENTGEISAIIDDLMTFAEPSQPRPAQTDIKKMLDEAIQLTSAKMNVEHINVQIEVADGLEGVFVDSGQIVSAIANVISNSLESYTDEMGPIKITADLCEFGDRVSVEVKDLGCGMDTETVQKATQLFFSARPAGRKRGMGLAHAQRLIELNGGRLAITSQPGKGTTVTILLATKTESHEEIKKMKDN